MTTYAINLAEAEAHTIGALINREMRALKLHLANTGADPEISAKLDRLHSVREKMEAAPVVDHESTAMVRGMAWRAEDAR